MAIGYADRGLSKIVVLASCSAQACLTCDSYSDVATDNISLWDLQETVNAMKFNDVTELDIGVAKQQAIKASWYIGKVCE